MRRIACWLAILFLMTHPAAGETVPGPTVPDLPVITQDTEGTILGLSYGSAALAAGAAAAGVVALNTYVAPNVGTLALTLWVAHWVVQGAVVYGAGSWLGWWDVTPAGEPVRLLKD